MSPCTSVSARSEVDPLVARITEVTVHTLAIPTVFQVPLLTKNAAARGLKAPSQKPPAPVAPRIAVHRAVITVGGAPVSAEPEPPEEDDAIGRFLIGA